MKVLKKLAVKRLTQLADGLELSVKDEWFDLASWSTKGFKQKKCGTTACAMGWAVVIFPRSKLRLVDEDNGNSDIKYKGLHGFEAAAKFMYISESDAEYLFAPSAYPDEARERLHVVERIRDFVDSNGCHFPEGHPSD